MLLDAEDSGNGPAVISLSRWLEQVGVTSCTAWRWRKKGWLKTVNICGRQYLTREAIEEFHRRAVAGEFSQAPHIPTRKAPQCTERFRLNDSEPHIEALQLQSIHEKINTIAGHLSKLVVAGPAVVQSSEPELKILPGGLDLDNPERGDQAVRALAGATAGD